MPMRAPSPSGEVLARNSTSWLVAAILLVSHAAVYGQVIRYVDASRPDDSGDGLSWANADKTLQAALAVAVSGDEIWVKAGLYNPDEGPGHTLNDRTETFQLIDGVEMYGGFAGTETSRDERDWLSNDTILGGDLSGNDAPLAAMERKLPVCADEACHDRASLPGVVGKYDMINIKLDKTGGLTEALALKYEAERLGLKVMVGCMIGSSLGMAPAVLVAQGAPIVDLDGPLLLAHDREHALVYDAAGVHPPASELWG